MFEGAVFVDPLKLYLSTDSGGWNSNSEQYQSTIYVAAWLYDWNVKMQPDLVELRNFLHEISGAAWIAVIGFLAKSFIDRDENGIPDQYEEEKENGKNTSEGDLS